MPAHHRSWLPRLACCLLVFCVSATLLPAFLIPIHSNVTSDALDQYTEVEIKKWERDRLKRGCMAADMVEGGLLLIHGPYEKRFHFDNDFTFQMLTSNFADVAKLIDANLAKPRRDPWEFGKALHAIEDVYSHSNYVELYRDYRTARGDNALVGAVPTFDDVMLQPNDYKDFIALLKIRLHTGRYPNDKYYPLDTNHGQALWFGPGMNKDSLARTLYEDARETAVRAAYQYLKLYLKDRSALQRWKKLKAIRFGAGLK
jgi:hypothetical protein